MQCACAILSSVIYPAVRCLPTLSNKGMILFKKQLLNVKCVLGFSVQFSVQFCPQHFSFYEDLARY